jgi:hypothetical protein
MMAKLLLHPQAAVNAWRERCQSQASLSSASVISKEKALKTIRRQAGTQEGDGFLSID